MNDKAQSTESLLELMAESPFLSALSEQQRVQLADSAKLQKFKLGDNLLSSGDEIPGLCLLLSGRVRLLEDSGDKEVSVDTRKAGAVFGEIGALRSVKSEFTIRGSGAGTAVWFSRESFKPVLESNPKARDFMASMAAIGALGGLVSQLFDLRGRVSAEEIADLVASVGIKNLAKGATILEQESRDDRRLYVIRQGKVSLQVTDSDDAVYTLANLGVGEIFGEKACLLRQSQMAKAVALSDVTLFVIPEGTVRTILDKNPKLRAVIEERISFLDRELVRQQRVRGINQQKTNLDLETEAKSNEKVIKRFPLVQQAEEMDCSAACLTMICKQHGLPLSLGKLRDLIGVDQQGANLERVAQVAESLGFHARGVQTTLTGLEELSLPFIAHWEGYHFVVVYGYSKEHVWVADPGPGFRKLTHEEFNRGWTGTCLTLTPGELKWQEESGESPWKRFFGYVTPHRRTLIHIFIAALVIQLLGLIPPVITQNVLDRVVVHENFNLLYALIIALVMSQVFAQVSTLVRSLLSNFMARSIDFAMMSGFFAHTLALPMSFFSSRRTGDIIARFQENQTIREFMTSQVSGTLLNAMMVVVYLTVMLLYSVQLTLILMAFIVPLVIVVVLITPKMKDYSRKVFETSTDAESVLMEALSQAESVKGMGIERPVRLKWENRYIKALNVQYEAAGFQERIGLVSQLLNIGGTVAVLFFGASMVMEQDLSIGQLIAFNMLAASVMGPLMALVGVWDEFHSSLVAMERLGDVLDVEPEQSPADLNNQVVIPDLEGHFQLENVYFRYGEANEPYILQNISLDIPAGQMVALVGLSGSGKSTLAKLLMGFYPINEGRILVDGYDLQTVEKQCFRAQVGYVMQSNMLFQGTIEENIAVGDDDPDRRRIIEVAQLADAHDFISAMPMGYQQRVGERGVGLSGGQVQRICIARALYKNPKVLILDEATSSLDAQSEGNVLSNMDGILEGRTTLVIAHRLSTVMKADQILVLYNGSIVEQGTHESLLQKGGMYQQLVNKQITSDQ